VSLVIPWQGKEYDIDPGNFAIAELRAVKERTGLTYPKLIDGLADMDPDAIAVLFWTVARRDDSALKYSEFAAPTINELLPYWSAVGEWGDAVGKAITGTGDEAGSPGSPSGTDSTVPSTTG
jgi:hypothetical protein